MQTIIGALSFACLEETDSSWSVAEPVVYTESMPRIVNQQELRKLFTGQAELQRESIVKRTVLSKATDWQYEQEWRVYDFSQTTEVEFLNYHPPELAAIYFGCRINDKDKEEIAAMAASINPSVELFTAKNPSALLQSSSTKLRSRNLYSAIIGYRNVATPRL